MLILAHALHPSRPPARADLRARCVRALENAKSNRVSIDAKGVDFGAKQRIKKELEALGYSVSLHDCQKEGASIIINIPCEL